MLQKFFLFWWVHQEKLLLMHIMRQMDLNYGISKHAVLAEKKNLNNTQHHSRIVCSIWLEDEKYSKSLME